MKSYIFAAATLLAAIANGAVLRREEEDCEDPAKLGYGLSSATDANAHPGEEKPKAFSPSLKTSLPCGATTSTSYTVVSGDTLGSISNSTGAGICDIAAANSITDINFLSLDQVLVIPKGCTEVDNTSCIPAVPTATCVVKGPSNHTIASGETLTTIAQGLNITLPALLSRNAQITNPDVIEADQIINVPVCGDDCSK